MRKKSADEAKTQCRRQELLEEQNGGQLLHMEYLQAQHRLTRAATEESRTYQVGHN